MNEHNFSRALRDSVPPRPDTTGWGADARRRARRRRAGVAAGALAAVVAILTPFALQWITAPDVIVASPSPAPSAAAQLVPEVCRDPAIGAVPLVDDDLSDGASRVWLCGHTDVSALELVGAPDPLVARADDAVAAFNAMEKSVGVLDCMPTPLNYTVVVEYPDGVRRAVRIAGCGDLRDATTMFDVFRADGAGYLAELRGLWAAEREENGFAFTGTEGLCATAPNSVYRPLDPASLTRAVTCRADGTAAELDQALTDDLLSAFRDDSTMSAAGERIETPLPDLVLLTATGDPVSLHRATEPDSPGTYWWDDGTQRQLWGPLDPALDARIVEAQGDEGGPTPAPSPPAVDLPDERGDTLAPVVCEDLQAGYMAPHPLPAAEDLAEGVARIWLCGDSAQGFGVGPVEPLTTDPDRVVTSLNALPAAQSDACTEMGGLTYHLVFDYPDGSRRIVAAETVNCQFVGGKQGRTGGAGLLQALLPMWAAQREAAPSPFTDDAAVCSDSAVVAGLNSLMPVERGSLYRGYVCGLPSDPAAGGEWIQRELPGDLVLALSQATPKPSGNWPPAGHSSTDHPYLVMLNQFGDPVTYPVDEDLGVRLPDGAWTPTGDVDAPWKELLTGLRGGS